MTTTLSEKRHARVDVADVLRGLAVMGIIVLHCIEHFNFYSFPDTSGDGPWLRFCDRAVWDGLFFILGGKAYAIFALLFGFSFFIQDDNQRLREKISACDSAGDSSCSSCSVTSMPAFSQQRFWSCILCWDSSLYSRAACRTSGLSSWPVC